MELSSADYHDGLLDDQYYIRDAKATTRRWKATAAAAGVVGLVMSVALSSLYSERAALRAQLLDQRAARATVAAAVVSSSTFAPATAGADTCTAKGTDIYGERLPAPLKLGPRPASDEEQRASPRVEKKAAAPLTL